ncbi:MAG: peroxiredoxin [Bacteroidia bacterium]
MQILVGKKAPVFQATAVVNGGEFVDQFSLASYLGNKYVVFFFYPKDFTLVCTSELHAFQEKLVAFEARGCAVVACSTDTEQSHLGWLQIDKDRGGIKGITFPLVADTNKTIASNFGVINGSYEINDSGDMVATSEMIAYSGLFLIDKNGLVRHQLINDFSLTRNVDEALRMVDALHFFEKNGEVCPAN